MLVGPGVELGGGDGGDAELHEEEPAELEIAWALRDFGGERVVMREVDLGEVGEDEVASFGFGVLGRGLEVEIGTGCRGEGMIVLFFLPGGGVLIEFGFEKKIL